jgi:hypothetical protein
MNTNYRKSDFKIEQIHGKPPAKSSHEARIRNYIFGARSLIINHTRNNTTSIRAIGYEVPIYARGKKRDECIDLVGYDEFFHPWIIELKIGKSSEPLDEVVSQVKRYMIAFEEGIREPVQKEYRTRLLWSSFAFKGDVHGMILADRSFYADRSNQRENSDGIIFCSFSGYADERTLLKLPRSLVNVKIQKRLKRASTVTGR